MLANLKLAIAGTIVMSPDLADALDALFMTRVPPVLPPVTTYPLPPPATTTRYYHPLPPPTTINYYPLFL